MRIEHRYTECIFVSKVIGKPLADPLDSRYFYLKSCHLSWNGTVTVTVTKTNPDVKPYCLDVDHCLWPDGSHITYPTALLLPPSSEFAPYGSAFVHFNIWSNFLLAAGRTVKILWQGYFTKEGKPLYFNGKPPFLVRRVLTGNVMKTYLSLEILAGEIPVSRKLLVP